MRILHIISSKGVYGAENVVLSLMKMLKKEGIYTSMICLMNKNKPIPQIYKYAKKENLNVKTLTCRSKMDFSTVGEIKKIIINENIDIVHTHGYKSNLYGVLSAKLTGKPAVVTIHLWTKETRQVRFYEWIDKKLVIKYADYIVAVSDLIHQELIQLGIKEKKAKYISNGIDTGLYSPLEFNASFKQRLGIDNYFVIGVVGRLTYQKGHIYLLKAFRSISSNIPDVKLLIVGEGELKKKLIEEADKLKIGNKVVFLGYQEDMVSVYRAMDIFVLPSISEGLPLVLLEAMSMGLPVVATRVGGIPSVANNENGILVPPRNEKALKEAMLRLIEDESLRKDMGKKARGHIISYFSIKSTFNKYLTLYNSLANNNRSRVNHLPSYVTK